MTTTGAGTTTLESTGTSSCCHMLDED